MNVRRSCLIFVMAVAVGAVFAQRTPTLPDSTPPVVRRVTIEQKYAEVGGESGPLGRPSAAETATPDGVGRYRLYQNGIIVWHPDLGAHALQGPIYYKYTSLSRPRPGETGFLTTPLQTHGYPTTDQMRTADGRGFYNTFQRGIVFYVPGLIPDSAGRQFAVEMRGPIYEKWKSLFHGGFDLGYPKGNQLPIDREGVFQLFEHGAIYWKPATGAHEVHGAIRERWIQSSRSTGERDGGCRGPIGYPIGEEHDAAGGGRIQDFEHASIRARVVPAPLSFVAYNAALLPHIVVARNAPVFGRNQDEYKGKNREAATNALIAELRRESPDIVGLSEVFISSDYINEFRRHNPGSRYIEAENDRQRVINGLVSMYPHIAEIPVSRTDTFKVDLPDPATYIDVPKPTELIFFSKFPIVARNHMTYTHTSGQDAKAAKGVLHIRVQPPGHPTGYDLFLTHTQNPGEGETDREERASREALRMQIYELAEFINAHKSPDRPALLMGDLNINGLDAEKHRQLLRDLGQPVDVWADTRPGAAGITSDHGFSSFAPGTPGAPATDPRRGRSGGRIDWLLSWPGTHYWPNYQNTEVLIWQFGEGHDVSDHYGLKTRQSDLREMTIIERVVVRRPR